MSSSPAMMRALAGFLCAIVLIAQQAALTHIAAHLPGAPGASAQQVAGDGQDHGPASGLASLCEFDAVFGQVLSGGPAVHHVLFFDGAASAAALDCSRAYAAADALVARSRGPPALL